MLAAATVLLMICAVRSLGVERPALLAFAGLLAVATGLTTHVFDAGHPADALLPLLWIVAAAEAQRGRAARAAAIVGMCAGFETWGVLGIAVLACAPLASRGATRGSGRRWASPRCCSFRSFWPATSRWASYHWVIMSRSLLGHVVAPGTSFGWPLRLAQGGLAFAAGVGVARAARHSPHALWLAPLVIVLVRIALDPLQSGYYFDGLQAPALAGVVLVAARGLRLRAGRVSLEPAA